MIVKYLKIVYLHFLKGRDTFVSELEVSTNFSMMENRGQRVDSLTKHMGESSKLEYVGRRLQGERESISLMEF